MLALPRTAGRGEVRGHAGVCGLLPSEQAAASDQHHTPALTQTRRTCAHSEPACQCAQPCESNRGSYYQVASTMGVQLRHTHPLTDYHGLKGHYELRTPRQPG